MNFLKSVWLWLWSVYKWAGSNAEVEAIWNAAIHSAVVFLAANTFEPSRKWLLAFFGFVVSGAFQAFRNYERNISTAPGASPNVAAKAALKKAILGMMLVGFMFSLAAPSHAYDFNLPSTAFKSCAVAPVKKALTQKSSLPPGLDTNALVAFPCAAFSVGTVQTSYGLSVAYCLGYGHLSGALGSTVTAYKNYLGVGVSGYLDAGDFLQSSFKSPLKAKAGAGVLLPELIGLTPSITEAWNLTNTKDKTTLISMNAPFGLVDAITYLVHQF